MRRCHHGLNQAKMRIREQEKRKLSDLLKVEENKR